MAIEDYVRIPGSARRYRNVKTGKEISRWDFDKLKSGGINAKEKAKIRKAQGVRSKNSTAQNRLNGFIQAYKRNTAAKRGVKSSSIKVRGNSADAIYFRMLHKELIQTTKSLKKLKGAEFKAADNRINEILIKLNMREPEWQYPRGHSPTTK